MLVVNVDWFFISHRLSVAENALKNGYKVTIIAKNTGRKDEILNKGFGFIELNFSRSGVNLFRELFTFIKLFLIYAIYKPTIVHHVTIKPVIYGTIIAKILKIKGVVNAISGLGFVFTSDKKGVVKILITRMMTFAFNTSNLSIIFQNKDDYYELRSLNVISSKNKLFWIKGSGVNLEVYKHCELPSFEKIIILFPARMLWDKGVNELYEASEIIKKQYQDKIQFIVCGMADEDNRAGVPVKFLSDWQDGVYVKWIGYQTNMIEVYKNSHIVVLPSYREGIPKTLIEACSIGRAIITTNAIGCKECVDEGINGYKVPVKDSKSLANALELLINNPDRILKMSNFSRDKAIKEFDINFVIKSHLEIYNQYV